MNKKDLINFIRVTNPIGEYFEELGGIFTYQDSSRLIITACPIYWFNAKYDNDLKLIECFNDKLKMDLKFNSLLYMVFFNFTIVINNHTYCFAQAYELNYVYNMFTDIDKTYFEPLLNNSGEEIVIPIIRSIYIE